MDCTALDESYVPDALDAVPAHASAAGMIYSFYGRLSVGNMDPDWLAEGDLPPTFYVYGTEDPFYRQFQQQYDVIRNMGISTGRIVLNGWPHGFGSDGGWVNDYAASPCSGIHSAECDPVVQRGIFGLKIGRNGTNYREPAFQSVDINAGSHIAADAVASKKAHLPLRSTR